jgi:hypothetical protein
MTAANARELGITALHPDCNYLDVMELHLERLHYGQPILKPVYDHSHRHAGAPRVHPAAQFVIVEGLLGFSTPVMRQFYDVKVYLNPPEGAARGLEDQARYDQTRLHAGAGAGRTGEARAGLARLHPPAAQARRHRGAVLPAGRCALEDAGPTSTCA